MSATVEAFDAYEEWRHYRTAQEQVLREESLANARLTQALTAEGIEGECAMCRGRRWFRAPDAGAQAPVSLRESLVCGHCNANARQRAIVHVLDASTDVAHARVYLTEQTSTFYLRLRRRCRQLVGSEFIRDWQQRLWLSLWLARQGARPWLRNEDVTALSFGDRSFDAVVSLDVLEHVPDHRRALSEFARVLRPGGALVFTVPFYNERRESEQIALVVDGRVEHLQPAEYHGDPVSSGALCFHHFGWDLLDAMRAAGFARAEALRVRDPQGGIPQGQWVLRGTR